MLKKLKDFNLCFMAFILMYSSMTSETGIISKNMSMDWSFLLLLLMTSLIMFMSMIKMSEAQGSNNVFGISLTMFFVFVYLFSINNMMNFYIMFELSVIPLMFLVSYWGYSLERVKAMFYMFLYTFFFSFPFFIMLMVYSDKLKFNILNNSGEYMEINMLVYTMMLGFMLVKMPMWGMHLWLMKAHVEASTEGSMILASIVLKLSGVAFIKMLFFLPPMTLKNSFFSSFLMAVSALGAIFLAWYTLRQADLKLLIAVSSVIHMSFMFILFNMGSYFSFYTLILVMLSHGLVSPIMFLMLGLMYEETSSRSSIIMKGSLKNMMYVSMIWFIICIFNMAVPLSMNFIAEIFFFYASASFNFLLCLTMAVLIFMNGVFNMYAYCSMAMGQNKNNISQNLEASYAFNFYSVIFMVSLFFFFC